MLFQPFVNNLEGNRLHDFIGVIEDDPELFWRLAPNQKLPDDAWPIRGLIANGDGLREDHEIPQEKKPTETRILFIGDSCTFGFGLLHNQTIVELTEELLQEKFPTRSIECINAGVPGYSAYQGWRYLETRGMDYDPDLVIFTFGWNDTRSWSDVSDYKHYEAMQTSTPPQILAWSRVSGVLWKALYVNKHTSRKDGEKTVRVPVHEFRTILTRVQKRTERDGVDLLLLAWPFDKNLSEEGAVKHTPYQKIIYELGEKEEARSVGYLDLIPVLLEANKIYDKKDLFIDYGHTRLPANQAIARALLEKLTPWVEQRVY